MFLLALKVAINRSRNSWAKITEVGTDFICLHELKYRLYQEKSVSILSNFTLILCKDSFKYYVSPFREMERTNSLFE